MSFDRSIMIQAVIKKRVMNRKERIAKLVCACVRTSVHSYENLLRARLAQSILFKLERPFTPRQKEKGCSLLPAAGMRSVII